MGQARNPCFSAVGRYRQFVDNLTGHRYEAKPLTNRPVLIQTRRSAVGADFYCHAVEGFLLYGRAAQMGLLDFAINPTIWLQRGCAS
jgi:hypothetical protein